MRLLLLKTLRDLRDAWAQSLALTLVVALGILSFVALVAAYRDLSTSYDHTYQRLKFADVTFRVDGAPQGITDDLAELPGVEAVTGRLILNTSMELPADAKVNPGEEIRARLIGLPTEHRPAVNDLLIEDGRYLNEDDERAMVLESHLTNVYAWGPGQTLTPTIRGEKVAFDAVGVAHSPEYLILSPSRQQIFASARSFAVMFVPRRELQDLTGLDWRINDIAVRLVPGANQERIVEALEDELEPYGLATTTLREDQPSNNALQLDLEGYGEISFLMPGIILSVAAFAIYIMLGRLVHAQRSQIGLMKALGYRNRSVVFHYLAFALTISLAGAALGSLGGARLAGSLTGVYARELGIPLLQTRFYPDLIGYGVLLGLCVSILAGIAPARAAARIEPAEAMHADPAGLMTVGRTSLIEHIFTPPLWLRLALRNVFRARRRTITTSLGVLLAYVLVLMTWGMLDSMNYLLEHNFQDVERWDIQVIFQPPERESIIEETQRWPGVLAAEPFIQLSATLEVEDQEEEVLLTAFRPEQRMHILQLPPGHTSKQVLGGRRIVLSRVLANKLDLEVGDSLMVDTSFDDAEFYLWSTSDEMAGSAAYIGLESGQELADMPVTAFNGLYLRVVPGQAERIESRLYELRRTANVQLKSDIQHTWRSLMDLGYVFLGVMMVFALMMAFALLFNTMTVNVLEREREFATMRAVGSGRATTSLLMAAESLILWIVTLVPGLLLGNWVAHQMGKAFSSELFSLSVVIAPRSYLITAGGVLLTMILAAWPAIWRVNHLNLAEATKVRP